MRRLLFVALCAAAVGCAKEPTGETSTSVVSGTLALKTFPTEPSVIAASNEKGATISTAPDAGGAFRLALEKGHTYELSVLFPNGSEPVVFPRASGSLDQTFKVSSGAAIVDMGTIRHLDAAPQGGFSVKSATSTSSAGDGECENGVDAKTGAACVDDQGKMSCETANEKGQDNQADGECTNGVDTKTGSACSDPAESSDPAGGDQADGECENGVDATTGAACTDPGEAAADAPMAIADHNVPEDVGGCNDSGAESDD
jgi:hypothetical protein